ncbi:hypothetical protein C7212DRAFT_180029 [Tuber magnatum]|uniref:DUF7514 domain-containing protein n=1 Tax=Tuber magnatum TaxID=42249 RepID=A0A317SW35_9PEZI|nr:hypothetical protein C7212DRAFT_180029 [Tuber magnatum]
MQLPGSFPSYPPGPAPQEPPQVPHHQYRQLQQQQQPQGYPPQQQGYFPPQPMPEGSAPPASPVPPPIDLKGPPLDPGHHQTQQRQNDTPRRETSQRYRSNTTSTHRSHASTPATSTSSGPTPKLTKMEGGSIHYETWGDLVDHEHGREPMPKEKLVRLLREVANYIIKARAPPASIVITPDKMVDFYAVNAVEGDDRMNWKGYFTNRTDSSLSSIYRVLGCEHFYIPISRDQKPTIPALTPQGFETWMFTQLMTNPSREAARLQKVVASWPIYDTKEGRRFPTSIPRSCFPEKEDSVILQGWWRVWEEFPSDSEDEEEERAPLALPAPGDSGSNRFYGPPPLQGPLPGADYATPAPTARKRTQQKYPPNPRDLNDDELDAIIESGTDKSPTMERHRKPYASSTGNPGWKEELNPRPTLGEDKASSTRNGPPPPSRPHTSHGHHLPRDAREFREESYAKPGPDRDPHPREPRDPRDPRDPREPRDPRDLLDSPEASLGRSKSTRRGHQRERSEYRRPHRHSHSHHRGGGRRDRSPADEHDQEWSGSSGVSAQTPTSAPDAGVPIPGATPAPLPPDAQDRRSHAQRKADEIARVARQQEELLRGYVPPGRYEPPADAYEYDEFPAPSRGRGGERDDRRVAEYAYQDEYDRDQRTQSRGGAGAGRRSSHYGGDRGRARDRGAFWGP